MNFCYLSLVFIILLRKPMVWEFPGSPEVRTLPFHCQGRKVQSLVGELSPQASWSDKKKKQKQNPMVYLKALIFLLACLLVNVSELRFTLSTFTW